MPKFAESVPSMTTACYVFSVDWSKKSVQGFTIAALIADDPEALLAKPGLVPEVADSLTRICKELAVVDLDARRKQVSRLASLLSPTLPDQVALAPRAQALLSRTVSKRVGRKWLSDAPPVRPGFKPEPGLIALLRRIAGQKAQSSKH
jgi:hypothetical protein